jgi:RNA polymerase sigma-70 factor (ECF subfamily)
MTTEQPQQKLERWLTEHRGLMLKIARSFASRAADQEDLLQEIAVALWKSIPRFRAASKESTWVYKVSLFTATTWSRAQQRRFERLVREEPARLESQEAEASIDPKQQWLVETIRTLSVDDRTLLVCSLEGYSHAEIAELTGLSSSNVGVRLHRLKQRLTSRAKEHFDEL